ncbi:MAG: PaaI family thioesterase [Candidatus Fermentibacter sp.]|nr:PaaI family thioesterase [Candidatus Fermentibacter sp.]
MHEGRGMGGGTGFAVNDDYCFVCGKDNPSGLRLSPRGEGGSCRLELVPPRETQGWAGVMHGGMVTAVLDEAMAYASMSLGGRYATAEISVCFRRPARTGIETVVTARVTESRGRLARASAEMLQEGEVVASGSASFILVGN